MDFSGNFILKNNNYLLTIDNTAVTTFSGASISTDDDRTLTMNVNSTSGAVVSGSMQDTGGNVLSVTKAGPGTMVLTANNPFYGATNGNTSVSVGDLDPTPRLAKAFAR